MKLYTEEQVLKFINDNFDEGCTNLNLLTPIELPSDEDIDIQSYLHNPFKKEDGHLLGTSFICGAKWVIEQIKKQDK